MHRYYAIHPDDGPLLPVLEGVLTGDDELEGFVACFADVESLLESGALALACVGLAEEPDQTIITFEADPAETVDPVDLDELAARPVAEVSRTPLRAFLEEVARQPGASLSPKAIELLGVVASSLGGAYPAPEAPEDEFRRDPLDPDPVLQELLLVASADADVLARVKPGPWVDGRDLPSGYRSAFMTASELLKSTALDLACVLAGEEPRVVVTIEAEDDMVVVPEAIDLDEPLQVWARPVAVVESLPVGEWLASFMPTNDEERARLAELRRKLGRADVSRG